MDANKYIMYKSIHIKLYTEINDFSVTGRKVTNFILSTTEMSKIYYRKKTRILLTMHLKINDDSCI